MIAPVLISLPLLLAACPERPSGLPGHLTSKDVQLMDFPVSLSPTDQLCHVVLLEEGIGHEWLLQFRRHNQLVVVRGEGTEAAGGARLTMDEYGRALDAALSAIEQRFPGRELHEVQVDLGAVVESWEEVVATTKRAAAGLSGAVKPKNRALDQLVTDSLSASSLLKTTCDVLARHGLGCSRSSGMDPVAFQHEHVGKPWAALQALEGAGLNEAHIWVGITVTGEQTLRDRGPGPKKTR